MTLSLTRRRGRLLLAAWVVIGACAESSREALLSNTKVSVHSSTPAHAGRVELVLTPEVELGRDGVLFEDVVGASILSNGSFAVLDRAAATLFYFDSTGVLLRRSGGPGGGPGEFRGRTGPTAMWRLQADSIGVWEHSLRRLSVFDAGGVFRRAWTAGRWTSYGWQALGRTQDGWIMAFVPPDSQGEEPTRRVGETFRPEVRYMAVPPDSASVRELGARPGTEYFVQIGRTGQPSIAIRPFGAAPAHTVGGNELYYASGDRPEIILIGLDGDERLRITWDVGPRRLQRSAIAAHKEQLMARAPNTPARATWQRAVDAAPYPDSVPATRRLLLDSRGHLWAQRYPLPGQDTVAWDVFDPAGTWDTSVMLPASFEPLHIRSDRMIGVYVDRLGVQTIRVHRLLATPAGLP